MLEQITVTDLNDQCAAANDREMELLAIHLDQRRSLDSIQWEIADANDCIHSDHATRRESIPEIKARERFASQLLQETGYALEAVRAQRDRALNAMRSAEVRTLLQFQERFEEHQRTVIDDMNRKHLELMDRVAQAMEAVAAAIGNKP